MKTSPLLLALAALSFSAMAEDLTLTNGTKLTGVTISRAEPDGVVVMTDDGIQKIPFAQLSPELQARYGYDPAKAAQFAAAVNGAAAQRGQQAAAAEAAERAQKLALLTPAAPAPTAGAAKPKVEPFKVTPGTTRLDGDPHDRMTATGAGLPHASAAGAGLPFPEEGHTFTLTELNEYRDLIQGHVVFVRLRPEGAEEEKGGDYKVFVSDGRASGEKAENYSYVWFPKEGAEKMRVMKEKGALSVYVKVEEKKLTAVARSKHVDSFHNTFAYTW